MLKIKKTNSFKANKENISLPKELMSNPINQKIRSYSITAEKFGKLIRAKAILGENTIQDRSTLSERKNFNNIRQSVIVES